ncbi:MAG: S1 RNA-binding domain-containing protein [Treponema sp.]|nr:S1 RNA-binding domain-containing protein [Candidatus Treponema equifaecale]
MNQFEIGEEIETTVVQVSGDTVFIDLGLKSEGFVDKAEFMDDDGNCSVKEGDKIKVYFVSGNRDELHFTTKLKGENADSSVLESAFNSGLPVEGHVEKEIKGGFEIKIGTSRAFCPYSQMGYKNRLEPAQYIGRSMTFVITEYKNEGKNIIVSNRRLEEQAENDKVNALADKLTEGTVVKGTVKSLQSYGAFVEVQGFQTLLPISEVSYKRVSDLSEVLSVGQEIEAKIIKAEWNTAKPERSKISLSMKSLETDPWSEVSSLAVGDKLTGKIARIAAFGFFVNLKPGIDGLVHISTLQDVNDKTNLSKKFKVGEEFDVVIQKIDADEKRISLAPATSNEQDDDASDYLKKQDKADDGDTYNPFAALLKKRS